MARRATPLTREHEARLSAAFGGSVAGIDEAGRGPWAGPVIAAAVILGTDFPEGLDDSKRLSAARREALFAMICDPASGMAVGIGTAESAEIDRVNILRATDLAMARALSALPLAPAVALVDGKRVPPGLGLPAEALVGGDGISPSIAAASIVAKVTRDRIMVELAERHPGYGWERNKGYGTAEHRDALTRLGVTAHHRKSFRPISNKLDEETTGAV
ncbi:MAG: ribonuclease HII [Pseudomonadota bacterium]